MKITLLTIASPEYWDMMNITAPSKFQYCLKNNIQFEMRQHSSLMKTIHDERIHFSLSTLRKCDWLWFMGADTLIMNQKIDVNNFLDPEYDFIIGEDINGINNDVFFLKNTLKSKLFLTRTLMNNPQYENEQESMKSILITSTLKTKIVHQKQFNSYLYDEYSYSDDKGGSYSEGDFILQVPGLPKERKMQLLNEYSKKILTN